MDVAGIKQIVPIHGDNNRKRKNKIERKRMRPFLFSHSMRIYVFMKWKRCVCDVRHTPLRILWPGNNQRKQQTNMTLWLHEITLTGLCMCLCLSYLLSTLQRKGYDIWFRWQDRSSHVHRTYGFIKAAATNEIIFWMAKRWCYYFTWQLGVLTDIPTTCTNLTSRTKVFGQHTKKGESLPGIQFDSE